MEGGEHKTKVQTQKLRPTRTRDIKMNKAIIDIQKSFISKNAALMAFQMCQLYFIQAGYLTTSSVDLETNKIELTVHFDLISYPTIPQGFKYSRREITSHTYYNDWEKKLEYVRCMDLYFKY